MLDSVEHEEVSDRRPRALQRVAMTTLRHVVPTQQASDERCGNLGVTRVLDEDVQHRSVIVDRPPPPDFDATSAPAHLVQMGPGTASGFPVAQAIGEEITEVDAFRADPLVSNTESSF